MPAPSPALGLVRHDHSRCIGTGLAQADAICGARGLRLTPARRRTLEILLEAHAALGAYDVLDRLAAEGLGDKPPVAYRALAFLVDHGLAHRIARLNAWVACTRPGTVHDPAFLICRDCGAVGEAAGAVLALGRAADAAGFRIDSTLVEAEGLCPACQDGRP